MSTTISKARQGDGATHISSPQPGASTNPFHTPFDNEDELDEDDEWWDDDVAPSMTKKEEEPTKKEAILNNSRFTQWPGADLNNQEASHPVRVNTRKVASKRYSVQRPKREASKGRQRKQNAKAGIKVITDLPPRHKVTTQHVRKPSMPASQPRQAPQAGMFVDLATLQSLNTDAPSNNPGFWKSMKGMLPGNGVQASENASTRNMVTTEGASAPTRLANRRGNGLAPSPIKLENDLSPSDRPIFIGISIPSARLAQHATSPQTAASDTSAIIQSYETQSPLDVPETPTIIITPAQNPSAWDPLAGGTSSNRPSSSVYSRSTNYPGRYGSTAAPPVPQLPSFAQQQSKKAGRESTGTIFAEDEDLQPASPNASRVMSSCTVFEEDTTPIAPNSALSPSDATNPRKSIASPLGDHRMSKGWWNVITTPFLTRSNTLASPNTSTDDKPPALPSLEIAAAKAQAAGLGLQTWEKMFSPVTPETSTTIASDAWWDKRNTIDGGPKNSESENNTYSSTYQNGWDDQSGTLPFMLSAGESTMKAARLSLPASGIGKAGGSSVERGLSTKSILTPSDREAPVMLDVSHLSAPHMITTPALAASRNVDRSTSRTRPPLSDIVTRAVATEHAAAQSQSPGESVLGVPPPYSPPRRHVVKMRPIFPPGHRSNLQPPHSPAPPSPGLQQAMGSTGAIQMAEIPLTPQLPRRPINLNSGYPSLPLNQGAWPLAPSQKAVKAEKKRLRYEKEERVAQKAGGFWRGRGCIPERGCYGRTGAEGRKRRRWYFGCCTAFFSFIIILSVVLATQLHRSTGAATQISQPSQWVNLTGFPPMFTGISTVIAPDNTVAVTACAFPATIWSCALPKELQPAGSQPNKPNFRLNVKWDSTSNANVSGNVIAARSTGGNAVSAGQFIKRLALMARGFTFLPSPTPPALAEQSFLGNTSDGVVSTLKDGEPTPFYVTFMDPTNNKSNPGSPGSNSTADPVVTTPTTNSTSQFPNITAFIPSPSIISDGTAPPAQLLPQPLNQPLRLFDRGLPTEHYGFYSYFDKTIFLKSPAFYNASQFISGDSNLIGNTGVVDGDLNGGATKDAARWQCTWAQTRYLVQIWTAKNATAKLLNATSQASLTKATNFTDAIANDFIQPGSFPYPITVTIDRHGGDFTRKRVYCYELDAAERPIVGGANGSPKLWLEFREKGGTRFNVPPSSFSDADDTDANGDQTTSNLPGYDGGTSGCKCAWQNWVGVVGA